MTILNQRSPKLAAMIPAHVGRVRSTRSVMGPKAVDQQAVKIGAGVVIIKDGKTLLTKRKGKHAGGTYGSLGGHVEYGENITEAIKREAREELGIEVDNLVFVSCANMIKYGSHYIDLTFSADILAGEPVIQEPDRIESVGWYDLDALPEPMFEPVRIALEAVKTGQTYFEVQELG